MALQCVWWISCMAAVRLHKNSPTDCVLMQFSVIVAHTRSLHLILGVAFARSNTRTTAHSHLCHVAYIIAVAYFCFARLVYWRRAGFLLLMSVLCIITSIYQCICTGVCFNFPHIYVHIDACIYSYTLETKRKEKRTSAATKIQKGRAKCISFDSVGRSFVVPAFCVCLDSVPPSLPPPIVLPVHKRLQMYEERFYCIGPRTKTHRVRSPLFMFFVLYVDRLLLYYVWARVRCVSVSLLQISSIHIFPFQWAAGCKRATATLCREPERKSATKAIFGETQHCWLGC